MLYLIFPGKAPSIPPGFGGRSVSTKVSEILNLEKIWLLRAVPSHQKPCWRTLASGISLSALLLPNYSLIAAFMAEHPLNTRQACDFLFCMWDWWTGCCFKVLQGLFSFYLLQLVIDATACVTSQVVPWPVCWCLLSPLANSYTLSYKNPLTDLCSEIASHLSLAASSAVFCRHTQSSVALTLRTETCQLHINTLGCVPVFKVGSDPTAIWNNVGGTTTGGLAARKSA